MVNEANSPTGILPAYASKLLRETPLLEGFHYEDALAFLGLGEEVRYSNGDILVNEGESLNTAILIAEGKVSLWRENIQLASLDEGSFIGESFLFKRMKSIARGQAERQTIVLKFERHDVLNFFRKKPGKLFNIFTKNIIEIQQEKIHNTDLQLIKLKKRLLHKDQWQ